MQEFVTFWGYLLSDISGFLMSEPIVWFVGIFLLLAVAKLFAHIIFNLGGKM